MDIKLNDKTQILLDFLANINCLDSLSRWTNDFNVFEVLKLERVEIRHSNMLAWLLDPNGNHGFGDAFLYGFLAKLSSLHLSQALKTMSDINYLQLLSSDLQSFMVRREWKKIDVLLYSRELKVVIAIENKIDSGLSVRRGTNKTQLDDYDDAIVNEYPGYQWARVLLSPDQSRFNDIDLTWGLMDYGDVITIIKQGVNKEQYTIKSEVKILIDNYIRLLKKLMNMEDKELVSICKKIYSGHKEALDLIMDIIGKETIPAYATCDKWVDDLKDAGEVFRDTQNSRFNIKFRSKKLINYFKKNDDWKKFYFYEIRIWVREDDNRVDVKLALVFHKDSSTPQEVFDLMRKVDPKSFNQWHIVLSKTKHMDTIDVDEDKLRKFLTETFTEFENKIPIPTSPLHATE